MNTQNGWTERDEQHLAYIGEILAGGDPDRSEAKPFEAYCTHLAGMTPVADEAFRRDLEMHLLTEWARTLRGDRTVIATPPSKWMQAPMPRPRLTEPNEQRKFPTSVFDKLWEVPGRLSRVRIVIIAVVLTLATAMLVNGVAGLPAMFVEEPSNVLAGLEVANERASFTLWATSEGELWRVNELGEEPDYFVIQDYLLDDGRRFQVSESQVVESLPLQIERWKTTDENIRIIEEGIDINGYEAVVYQMMQPQQPGSSRGRQWGEPVVRWDADGTAITLSGSWPSQFTVEELLELARSFRPQSK